VHEVVGDVDALERGSHRGWIEDVSAHDLGRLAGPAPQLLGPTHKTANTLAARLQGAEQATADIAGRAREQCQSNYRLPCGVSLWLRPNQLASLAL
jgi:hypothetical protein